MIQDKISFKLTIPTLVAIISIFVGILGYLYSIDKRISLVEQDVIQQDHQLNRMEDKIEKIYLLLVAKISDS